MLEKDLDHVLLYQARKLMTGANVHGLKQLIFCYEISEPGSDRRTKYEQILRGFVADHGRLVAARMFAEQARERSRQALAASDAVNQQIDNTETLG